MHSIHFSNYGETRDMQKNCFWHDYTGLHRGVCTTIKKKLGKELIRIACRRHVLNFFNQINTCNNCLEHIISPMRYTFGQMRNKWTSLNENTFEMSDVSLFNNSTNLQLRKSFMILYLRKVLKFVSFIII